MAEQGIEPQLTRRKLGKMINERIEAAKQLRKRIEAVLTNPHLGSHDELTGAYSFNYQQGDISISASLDHWHGLRVTINGSTVLDVSPANYVHQYQPGNWENVFDQKTLLQLAKEAKEKQEQEERAVKEALRQAMLDMPPDESDLERARELGIDV